VDNEERWLKAAADRMATRHCTDGSWMTDADWDNFVEDCHEVGLDSALVMLDTRCRQHRMTGR